MNSAHYFLVNEFGPLTDSNEFGLVHVSNLGPEVNSAHKHPINKVSPIKAKMNSAHLNSHNKFSLQKKLAQLLRMNELGP